MKTLHLKSMVLSLHKYILHNNIQWHLNSLSYIVQFSKTSRPRGTAHSRCFCFYRCYTFYNLGRLSVSAQLNSKVLHDLFNVSTPSKTLKRISKMFQREAKARHRWDVFWDRGQEPDVWQISKACSWGTGPAAWGRRRPGPPPLRPAPSRTDAGCPCPRRGFSWGCPRPCPQTGPGCWAGSRRRRSTDRLWSQPGTRTACWRPRGSRSLQTRQTN